ncbi:MAG: helix-turn-helix transcriptional regulator [Anaerolineae bacterium]|nr:helix-turn-helix transcriptional regulator [Anaerolineae bacterium]
MGRPAKKNRTYDPQPLAQALRRLMAEHGLSHRQAALQAGLDRGAMYRFVDHGQRPSRDGVIALADSFGVNPNELLALAGYPPLAIFETALAGVPPDMRGVIDRLQAIGDPVARSRVIGALETLLDGLAQNARFP